MTMLLIVCDASIEERVLEGLRSAGVSGYTRFPNLTGAGRVGRRDGDPVWPGTNSMIMVVTPAEVIDSVRDLLLTIKRDYTRPPALHVFSLSATELL